MAPPSASQPRAPRLSPIQWTDEAEEVLLTVLVEQVRLGKRAENGYKAEAWEEVCKQLMQQMSFACTKDQAKNKNNMLKTYYRTWCELQDTASGFGWDGVLERYTAEDGVWDLWCKVRG